MYTIKQNIYTKIKGGNEQVALLPSGIYHLQENGCLIKQEHLYNLPQKIYGDFEASVDRYISTFHNREKNTNILFSGEKGNGKSLISKLLCNRSNMPCIIVTAFFDNFAEIINLINQECVVFIDEFDKIYDTEERQNSLLSLLDGAYESKKMFVFTSNSTKLNTYLQNRPGRIYYHKSFDNVSRELVREIVDDRLIFEEYREELISLANVIGNINLDTLLALIEEVNMYNEKPSVAIEHLNITFEKIKFSVIMLIDGKRYETFFVGHPLKSNKFVLEYKEDGDDWWRSKTFSVDLEEYNIEFTEDTTIEFNNKNNKDILIFEQYQEKSKKMFSEYNF